MAIPNVHAPSEPLGDGGDASDASIDERTAPNDASASAAQVPAQPWGETAYMSPLDVCCSQKKQVRLGALWK